MPHVILVFHECAITRIVMIHLKNKRPSLMLFSVMRHLKAILIFKYLFYVSRYLLFVLLEANIL